MKAKKVRKVYQWYAKWYDSTFTRSIWKIFFAQAEVFIQQILRSIHDAGAVLDVGVGTGVNIQRFLDNKIVFRSYEGIDLTPEMVAVAKRKFSGVENLTFLVGDITKILIEKRYDTIISTLVFSHLDKQDEVVQKLLGMLQPNGVFILMDFTERESAMTWWEKLTTPIWLIFKFKPIPKEVVAKFPATETKKHFSCPGGQISIFVFHAQK